MRKFAVGLALVTLASSLSACAYPPGPPPPGYGYGYWRACPPGWHLGPWGRRCWRNW